MSGITTPIAGGAVAVPALALTGPVGTIATFIVVAFFLLVIGGTLLGIALRKRATA